MSSEIPFHSLADIFPIVSISTLAAPRSATHDCRAGARREPSSCSTARVILGRGASKHILHDGRRLFRN